VSCAGCGKPVYAMEKQMSASGQTFHQACFKCTHCKSQLTLSNWSIGDGKVFCKTHYLELFKGNEDWQTLSARTRVVILFCGVVWRAVWRDSRSKRRKIHIFRSRCDLRVRFPRNFRSGGVVTLLTAVSRVMRGVCMRNRLSLGAPYTVCTGPWCQHVCAGSDSCC
jgi:hypothetical protein